MNRATVSSEADRRSTDPAGSARGSPAAVDAVHVRNYDHRQGHSVRVAVARDGEVRLAERHYLAPGRSARVAGPIDPGEHRLRVWVDGVERERANCSLDGTPAGTAVVELGNGVVSLTAGATAVSAPDPADQSRRVVGRFDPADPGSSPEKPT